MGQLTAYDFQSYLGNTIQDEAIEADPLALFTASASDVSASYLNAEFAEAGDKASGADLLATLSAVRASRLEDIEPVIIGPGRNLDLLN